MPVYKAEGVVLHRRALGEADRAVTLFTREHGKVRASARGTRKTASRLAGRLEPFTHARFLLARGRSLDVIAQVDVIHAFAGLRGVLLRSAYASYVAELVDRFLPERDAQDGVFELVLDTLDALDRAGEDEVEVQALWFALRLTSDLGYRPDFERCMACGRAVSQGAAGPVGAWAFNPGLVPAPPVAAPDGTTYFATPYGVFAYDSSGAASWSLPWIGSRWRSGATACARCGGPSGSSPLRSCPRRRRSDAATRSTGKTRSST